MKNLSSTSEFLTAESGFSLFPFRLGIVDSVLLCGSSVYFWLAVLSLWSGWVRERRGELIATCCCIPVGVPHNGHISGKLFKVVPHFLQYAMMKSLLTGWTSIVCTLFNKGQLWMNVWKLFRILSFLIGFCDRYCVYSPNFARIDKYTIQKTQRNTIFQWCFFVLYVMLDMLY